MKYLGYYEVLEGSVFYISNTLVDAKSKWCFQMRIFKVPSDFDINKIEKPRYNFIEKNYELVYSDGRPLMHVK